MRLLALLLFVGCATDVDTALRCEATERPIDGTCVAQCASGKCSFAPTTQVSVIGDGSDACYCDAH